MAAPPVDECATAAMKLAVTPPAPDGPKATFSFRWDGEGIGESSKVICVIAGNDRKLVPRGTHHEVAIRADAKELQRIVVDGRPHLMFVPPSANIVLGDNPCFFYELSGPNTDAWFVGKPHAYCEKPSKPCKPGYVRASPPRPVQDELCGSTEQIRRCVAQAQVRLTSPPPPEPTQGDEDQVSLADLAAGVRLSPRTCGFAMVATGREQVALVIGSGERWQLSFEGDQLVGRVE